MIQGAEDIERKNLYFFYFFFNNQSVTFIRPLNIIVITLEQKQEPFVTLWVSSMIFKGLLNKILHEEQIRNPEFMFHAICSEEDAIRIPLPS